MDENFLEEEAMYYEEIEKLQNRFKDIGLSQFTVEDLVAVLQLFGFENRSRVNLSNSQIAELKYIALSIENKW